MTPHYRADEFIGDFKQHPLFGQDNTALQIVMYYGEVETANCLGSHAGYNCKLGKLSCIALFPDGICND